jgi:hypothetical protein
VRRLQRGLKKISQFVSLSHEKIQLVYVLKVGKIHVTCTPKMRENVRRQFTGTRPSLRTDGLADFSPASPQELSRYFLSDSTVGLLPISGFRGLFWGFRCHQRQSFYRWQNGLPAQLSFHVALTPKDSKHCTDGITKGLGHEIVLSVFFLCLGK